MTSKSSSRSSSRPPMAKAANSFIFGSSTPRELSHITHPKMTRKEQLIDTKLKPKPNSADDKKDIVFYMRQARSIGGRGGPSRSYAFGSSTPRSLSHLSHLAKEQRVYDAKAERRTEQRSETNPQLANARGNRSLSRDSRPEEDALSEPDLVQDRQKEFHQRGGRRIEEEEPVKRGENGQEEEGEDMGQLALALETRRSNHRAVARELVGEEGPSQGALRIHVPHTERAEPVQLEEGREMGQKRDGPSPVSDF